MQNENETTQQDTNIVTPMQQGQKRHRLRILVMTLLFIIVLGIGFAGGWYYEQRRTSNTTGGQTAGVTPELLFVLNGETVVAGSTITIQDNSIEWFTSSPQRDAGYMTPQQFVAAWNDSSVENNTPNAAFSNIATVVELKGPALDDNGDIRFEFSTISGELYDGTYTTSLFVDALPTNVNGQITDAVNQADNDEYCFLTQTPWTVTSHSQVSTDNLTCDQRNEIIAAMLKKVQLDSYAFDINVNSAAPQTNTQWLCDGIVRPTEQTETWEFNDALCSPTDKTLSQEFGFYVSGSTKTQD